MAASGDDNKIPIPDSLRRALSSEGRDLLRQAIDDGRGNTLHTPLPLPLPSWLLLAVAAVLAAGASK